MQKLSIPILSALLQKSLSSLIEKSGLMTNESYLIYNSAEQILLKELNLHQWQPTEENKAIKRFSSSFGISGRLDAEYYQTKFDDLMRKITSLKYQSLNSLVSFKKSIEPGSDAYQTEGIPFIRVSDISKFGIFNPEHHLDREIYEIDNLKPKKDTILLTKDGSIGM